MNTLYHYVHCPYCIRVRFAASFLKKEYQSTVLSYADELAPVELTGVKMLPIWKDETKTLNESLDIITYLDRDNQLRCDLLQDQGLLKKINDMLDELAGPVFKLCMPYFVWTPEFDQNSRAYFLKKKEAKRGPFNELLKQRDLLETQVQDQLLKLEDQIDGFFYGDQLTVIDLMIASHLWGLYTVPEFRFSDKWNQYLQKIKTLTGFDYFVDYQRDEFWAPARRE